MLIKLEILEFQFGNWFWEGKIGIWRKDYGNQKVYGKRHFCNGLYLE